LRKGKGRVGASDITVDLAEKLVRWSGVGLKLFGVVFAVGTAYLLWGIYGGYLAEGDPRTIGNLRLMGQVMTLGGALATVCLVIVSYEEVTYAVLAGMVGGAYWFGTPLLMAGQLQNANEAAADVVQRASTLTGQCIVVIVGLRVVIEIIRYAREGPSRRATLTHIDEDKKKVKVTTRPWYRLSRCWELPYCHQAIREFCPAYKQGRSCWRLGLGCNCDPHMIEALIRSGGAERGKSDTTSGMRGVHEAYVRSDLTGDRVVGKAERTRTCKDCPIYNEHQRQKFRVFNPIIITGTIVALLAGYPLFIRGYKSALEALTEIVQRLAYGKFDPSRWFQGWQTPAVRTLLFLVFAGIALSYILKLVEWAILVRKL
jgi:hypothetical protein